MTDRELLEFAAKAAGLEAIWDCAERGMMMATASGIDTMSWNPLTDDGDALRLAVKLGLDVCIDSRHETKPRTLVIGFIDDNTPKTVDAIEYYGDQYAATRRAIVRAAAEIGRSIP